MIVRHPPGRVILHGPSRRVRDDRFQLVTREKRVGANWLRAASRPAPAPPGVRRLRERLDGLVRLESLFKRNKRIWYRIQK